MAPLCVGSSLRVCVQTVFVCTCILMVLVFFSYHLDVIDYTKLSNKMDFKTSQDLTLYPKPNTSSHRLHGIVTHKGLKGRLGNHTKLSNKMDFKTSQDLTLCPKPNTSSHRLRGIVTHKGLKGRLGNQIFQVAAVFGMAYDLDMIPVVNVKGHEIAKYFDVPNLFNIDIGESTTCNENSPLAYSNCSETYQNRRGQTMVVSGYRQSWKYFVNASSCIRKLFKFKKTYIDTARNFVHNSRIYGYDNVCIHVRRGDFLNSHDKAVGRDVADVEFLSKAIQFYNKKLNGSARFIVLSDDIKWCKQNMKGHLTFSPFYDPGVDLAIMSLCDHVVVSSGSFGWWGAWLSNGSVVYFHGYPRKGSVLDKLFNEADYYPPNWKKI